MDNVTGAEARERKYATVQNGKRRSPDNSDCVEQVSQRVEVYRLLQMRGDFDAVDLGQLARGFAQPIVLSADNDQRAFEADFLEGREDRKPVLVGHAQIECQDVRLPICQDVRDGARIRYGFGLIAASDSDARDEFRRFEIVVDRQQPLWTWAWLVRIRRREGHVMARSGVLAAVPFRVCPV